MHLKTKVFQIDFLGTESEFQSLIGPRSEFCSSNHMYYTSGFVFILHKSYFYMRIKRSYQLFPDRATIHLYWRCHNKESYLESPKFKDLYLKCLEEALEYNNQKENCKIHAFCVMSNHFHQLASYQNGSDKLSNFMRYSHALFGIRYNRAHRRSGKVAEGRPKTPLIQNITHEMRVQFYIEANPIRARIRTVENLKSYPYSSYGFYAYGIKTKFTHLLTIPEWYLALGPTPQIRQEKYRKLFQEYLNIESSPSHSQVFKRSFIGDLLWVEEIRTKIKTTIMQNLVQQISLDIGPPNSA